MYASQVVQILFPPTPLQWKCQTVIKLRLATQEVQETLINCCVTSFIGSSPTLFCLLLLYNQYKTISTTYVVEPKILHYLVHVLHSNTPMNILQSHVDISVKLYLRKSGC